MSYYENHNLSGEPLPFIFKERSAEHRGEAFGASNWHENIEILRIISGDGMVSDNGRISCVHSGEAVVFNSNSLHAVAARCGRIRYDYLIIDRSFCLGNGFDTSKISFDARLTDGRASLFMNRISELYAAPEDTPYRTLLIRAKVLEFLAYLCTEHGKAASHGEVADKTVAHVKKAISYIRASYDKDISLDDVSEFVGVNKCYLSREFHKYTGYPFVSYVNRTRCKRACELLAEGRMSVSEVGCRCGFRNSSYFAKEFKRYIGVSPGEYRK